VRILCSALPLEGHVQPLLPLAVALVRDGHDVRFATGPDLHARIRQAGVIPVTAGPSFAKALETTSRLPRLLELPLNERGGATFSQVIAPAKLPDLERIVDEWQPDLVVHECTDMAAPIAAAARGLPTVTQGWGLIPLPGLTTPSPADVASLWRSRGLQPDPYAGIFGCLYLHPVPPGLQPDPKVPVGRVQLMRVDPKAVADTELPAWAEQLGMGEARVVYVSLGTHPYFSQPEFFRVILDGLASAEVEVVATLGEHTDPASLGPQSRHVHLERWLPLSRLLPRCSLVVCHAGSGTLLASLAAGLPLLLLPRGADQFQNATASEQAGVARVILPDALTPNAVAREVAQLLISGSYRQAAARLRAEIETMPAPSAVVPLLEELIETWPSRSPPPRTMP